MKGLRTITCLFLSRSVVVRGYRRTLTFADVWDIRRADSARVIVPRFRREWERELRKLPTS